MTDLVFEGLRAFVVGFVLLYLFLQGRKAPLGSEKGWRFILAGFGLILFGSIIDIGDNFPSLNHLVIVGDTPVQAFLEKVVGFLGGLLLLAAGFRLWIPAISARVAAEEAYRKEYRLNDALAELSEMLISAADEIEPTAHLVLDKAKEMTDSAHGFVCTIDPGNGDLIGVTLTEMMGKDCLLEGSDKRIVFPPEPDGTYSALWGHALNVRKAFYTNSPPSHPSSRGVPKGHIRLERYLSAPAVYAGKLVGLVGVANSKRDYGEGDLAVIERIADLYALAVDRYRSLQERERLGSLLDHAVDSLVVHDMEGNILYANDAACCTRGYEKEEFLAMKFDELIVPGEEEEVRSKLRELTTAKAVSCETVHRLKDGGTMPVELRCHLEKVEGRRLIVSVVRDITERQAAEKKNRQSQDNLEAMIQNIPYGMLLIDRDKRILHANDKALKDMGYSALRDVMGRLCHETMCPAQMDKCPILDLGMELDRSEKMLVRKDGQRIPILKSVVPITLEGSELLLETYVDITELKKAQEFIGGILESVDESFMVIDREYRILTVNKAFTNMACRPLEDVLGRRCYEICYGFEKPCHELGEKCTAQRTFDTAKPYSFERAFRDSSGCVTYTEVKSFPLMDSAGSVSSVIEVINDITEKKKLEGQLLQAQKMEAVGTLTGGIAHDFNNILMAIMGFGEMLHNEISAEPMKGYVEQILKASDGAATLTASLLAFSRRQESNPLPVNLNQLVIDMEKILGRLIGEDVELSLNLREGPLMVNADKGQIEQVLVNLATNARDALTDGGFITIESEVLEIGGQYGESAGFEGSGSYACLSFSDNGAGMDSETAERIFEPFFTTKEIGHGTGLGLSTTYGIIKSHKGHISVYSQKGEGTTFKILLPLIALDQEKAAKAAELDDVEGGNETIFIAEDNEAIREMLGACLRNAGYDVVEAADGEEAVRKYVEHQGKIDLLLLDVILPKLNGRMVYEKISSLSPGIRTVFVSGYSADIMKKKGIVEEGLSFVTKPVMPGKLLRIIREKLDEEPPG